MTALPLTPRGGVFGACTTAGRRKQNEDSLLLLPQRGVFAIADGMGGHGGGDVASRIAIRTVSEFFSSLKDETGGVELELALLDAAIRRAHQQIQAEQQREGQSADMGSTIVLVCLVSHAALVGHLGDSRVYLLRHGTGEPVTRLFQVTQDHSLYERLRAEGVKLPPLREYSHRHVITRSLGHKLEPEPDLQRVPVEAGDRLLLCSDGLDLEPSAIAKLLDARPVQEACEHLVGDAFRAGSDDNITTVVIEVTEP